MATRNSICILSNSFQLTASLLSLELQQALNVSPLNLAILGEARSYLRPKGAIKLRKLSFANLSVTFGKKELLDYKEIVTAAFLVDTHIRKYGRTRYHFYETELILADPDDPLSLVISGRFVKDTVLQREQVLHDKELVQDKQSLRSSPSAFFVFFLADHRLAFLPETSHAPTLDNFAATIERFIKDEFASFIEKVYRTQKELDPKYSRRRAFQDHVPPSVSLVPLTSRDSVEVFLNRFEIINNLTVHVIKRNQDVDGGNIFERLYEKANPLEPTSAKFVVNGGKDGLVIDKTKEMVIDATASGYEQATVTGADSHGATLKGSNEDFNLKVDIDVDHTTAAQKTALIFDAYQDQKRAGNIKVTPRNRDIVGPQLKALYNPDD